MALKAALELALPRYVPVLPEGVVLSKDEEVPSFVPYNLVTGVVKNLDGTKLGPWLTSLETGFLFGRKLSLYHLELNLLIEKYVTVEFVEVQQVIEYPNSFVNFWKRAVKGEWKKWEGPARIYGALFARQIKEIHSRFGKEYEITLEQLQNADFHDFMTFLLSPIGVVGGTYFLFDIPKPVVVRVKLRLHEALEWLRKGVEVIGKVCVWVWGPPPDSKKLVPGLSPVGSPPMFERTWDIVEGVVNVFG